MSEHELLLKIEKAIVAAAKAELILTRWLSHQYGNDEQYKKLQEARDHLRGIRDGF